MKNSKKTNRLIVSILMIFIISSNYAQNYPTYIFGSNTSTCSIKSFSYQPGSCSSYTSGICVLDFGDGSPIQTISNQNIAAVSHNFPNTTSAIYTVTVSAYTNSNSATPCETATCAVFVNCGTNPVCYAAITVYQSTIACNNVNFINNSIGNGTIYKWDFGDGTSSHSINYTTNHIYPNAIGTYTATLNMFMVNDTINPCSSASQTLAVNCITNINALFTVTQFTSVCNNFVFHNTSTGSGNFYKWNYGDGTVDYNTNPYFQHVYPITGPTYTATLYKYASPYYGSPIMYTFLCDSFQQIITVNCPNTATCQANLSVSQSTANCTSYVFTNNSNSVFTNNCELDFGDGTSTIIPEGFSLIHNYLSNGVFTPTLNVYSILDTINPICSTSQSISINCIPSNTCNASFTYTTSSYSADFTANNAGPGALYFWSFGNSAGCASSTSTSMNTLYSSYGTYTVSLSVYLSSNTITPCSTSTQTIVLSSGTTCQAAFTYSNNNCNGVALLNNSTGTSNRYVWDFGDGTTSDTSGIYFTHQYSTNGIFNISLSVYSLMDSIYPCDNIQYLVSINCTSLTCQAAFNYKVGSNCNNIDLENVSLGNPYRFVLDYGDGFMINPNSNILSHNYTSNGIYNVVLAMYIPSDTLNPCSLISQSISINCSSLCQANSNFNIFADTLNLGQYFAYNTSTGNGTLTYLWNFGDGTTSTQQYPFHQYTIPGQYLVCLQVTSTSGTTTCSDTYCDSSSVQRIASGFQMSSINVIPKTSTGINNITISNSLIVYPNPFSDEIIIDVDMNNFSSLIRYQLHDALGKIISENEIKSSKTIINAASLEQGFYFISIKNDVENILKTIKLVK